MSTAAEVFRMSRVASPAGRAVAEKLHTPAPAGYWASAADLAAGVECIERPMTAAEEVLTFRVGQPAAGTEKSAPAPALAPRHRTPATRVQLRAAPPAGWALTPKEK